MSTPFERRFAEADAILEQALDRPPGERLAFVRKAAGDDQELRQMLERLVAEGQQTNTASLRTGGALNGPLGAGLVADLAAEEGLS